jgi:hypothetical protein
MPRRGKANRMNNWERFGNFAAGEAERPYPNSRPSESSPNRGGGCFGSLSKVTESYGS